MYQQAGAKEVKMLPISQLLTINSKSLIKIFLVLELRILIPVRYPPLSWHNLRLHVLFFNPSFPIQTYIILIKGFRYGVGHVFLSPVSFSLAQSAT